MAITNTRQIPKEFQGVNLEALTSELHISPSYNYQSEI